MRPSTSVWSPICEIHSAETKAVPATAGSPASASCSISSTFTAVGTSRGSFCRPSRGPTSTIFTRSFKADELRALEHLVARGVVDFLHHAVCRRRDGVLHLHRLEHQKRVALRHPSTRLRHHLDDPAGHRRGERARTRVLGGS